MSLFVRSPDQAEMILEQEMALEPQELRGDFPVAVTHDASLGDFRVIVADSGRDTAEELERAAVSFQDGFGAFPGNGLAENRIGVRQCHHEQRDFDLFSVQSDIGITEIDLGFSRRMRER